MSLELCHECENYFGARDDAGTYINDKFICYGCEENMEDDARAELDGK